MPSAARSIARNRERLLALGIPSLVKELQAQVGHCRMVQQPSGRSAQSRLVLPALCWSTSSSKCVCRQPHPLPQAGAAAAAAKPKKKKAKRDEGQPRGRQAAAAGEQPTRRSSRVREAAEHPKPKPETGGCRVVGLEGLPLASTAAAFGP